MSASNKKQIRSDVGQTAAGKREFTEEEKGACSIEAMRTGGTCEACQ